MTTTEATFISGTSVGDQDTRQLADSRTLAALIHRDRDLADALQAGDVKIEGRIAAVERFVTLFPLPEPATPGSVLAVEGAH